MSKKAKKVGKPFELSQNKIQEIVSKTALSLYNDFRCTLESGKFSCEIGQIEGMRVSFPASQYEYFAVENKAKYKELGSIKNINDLENELARTTSSTLHIYLSQEPEIGWMAIPYERNVPLGMEPEGYVKYVAGRLYKIRQQVWNFEVPHIKG